MSNDRVLIEIWVETDRIDALVMDIKDMSPEANPKKDDWHKLLAESIEDQAGHRIRESEEVNILSSYVHLEDVDAYDEAKKDCSCTDCKCGKEDTIKASVRVEKFGAKLESMLSSISSGNNHRGFGNTQQTG